MVIETICQRISSFIFQSHSVSRPTRFAQIKPVGESLSVGSGKYGTLRQVVFCGQDEWLRAVKGAANLLRVRWMIRLNVVLGQLPLHYPI